VFYLNPIAYWDAEECQYDQEVEFLLPELPFNASEASECFFEWELSDATPEAMHDALLKMGFVYREDFAAFSEDYED